MNKPKTPEKTEYERMLEVKKYVDELYNLMIATARLEMVPPRVRSPFTYKIWEERSKKDSK